MTSACTIKFDNMEITIEKAGVPDEFIFLFQECDRRVSPSAEPDDEYPKIGYFASRAVVLQRLDLGGFTAEHAARAFEAWLNEQRERWESYTEGEKGWGHEVAAALYGFSYAEWGRRLKDVLMTRYDLDRPLDEFDDEIDKSMRSLDQEWIFFSDFLTSIRAMLDALPDVQEVSLDVGALIYAGWIELDERICETRRSPDAQWKSVLQPTVIIAEGGTDNIVLQQSLKFLYPHLSEFVSFFDYEDSKADGGASFQVKFLRAFSAARINTSILAIFDNDAAGHDAFNAAVKLKLPNNIIATKLPDIELACDYPTIGPQGRHNMNVNGKAVSIEMFLGRHNLSQPDGTLTPIVWGGYVSGVQSYQGRVEDTRGVLERFFTDTNRFNPVANYAALYPELDLLWRHIFLCIKSANSNLAQKFRSE